MNDPNTNSPFNEEERRILAAAVPPIPLDEAKIRATLARAGAETQRGGGRPGPRWRTWAVAGSITVALGLLVAGGYWRYRGESSDKELTFGAAIEVTRNLDSYPRAQTQSATGKIWKDTVRILAELRAQGGITPGMQAALVRALDSPQRIPVPYNHEYEALRVKVTAGQRLTPAETEALTQALCAGVDAMRELAERDERFVRLVTGLCVKLRADVTKEPDPPKPAPKGSH